MTLCTWQHERGALFIIKLTDSDETLSEEQFVALEALHPSEGSAWLGRDLRQIGSGARFESNLYKFTKDATAKTGPLDSEELCHLLETVILGEASQRLRDSTLVSTDIGDRSQ